MYAGVIGASNRITGRRRRIRHSSPQTAPDRAADRTRARGDLAALCTPLDAQPALTAAVQQDLEAGPRSRVPDQCPEGARKTGRGADASAHSGAPPEGLDVHRVGLSPSGCKQRREIAQKLGVRNSIPVLTLDSVTCRAGALVGTPSEPRSQRRPGACDPRPTRLRGLAHPRRHSGPHPHVRSDVRSNRRGIRESRRRGVTSRSARILSYDGISGSPASGGRHTPSHSLHFTCGEVRTQDRLRPKL